MVSCALSPRCLLDISMWEGQRQGAFNRTLGPTSNRYVSVLPVVFLCKILIEQRGLCITKRLEKIQARSSSLFLGFPFSQIPPCFLLGILKFVRMGGS